MMSRAVGAKRRQDEEYIAYRDCVIAVNVVLTIRADTSKFGQHGEDIGHRNGPVTVGILRAGGASSSSGSMAPLQLLSCLAFTGASGSMLLGVVESPSRVTVPAARCPGWAKGGRSRRHRRQSMPPFLRRSFRRPRWLLRRNCRPQDRCTRRRKVPQNTRR